jgi:hypothetical protein
VPLVGADRESGVDQYEFARRRLTAAAYGFASWTEFRGWRKRNPAEYRARSRRLLDPSDPVDEPAMVIELYAGARRVRDESANRDEPASS